PNNGLATMINAGSKGSPLNMAMMSSIVGQQLEGGKRLAPNLPGKRVLPIFQPGDTRPEARGFCKNSFLTGLTAEEWFMHSTANRESLIDTSLNTAKTGALRRDLVKANEDLYVAADGSVRGPNSAIIEFVYGDDGLSSGEVV